MNQQEMRLTGGCLKALDWFHSCILPAETKEPERGPVFGKAGLWKGATSTLEGAALPCCPSALRAGGSYYTTYIGTQSCH